MKQAICFEVLRFGAVRFTDSHREAGLLDAFGAYGLPFGGLFEVSSEDACGCSPAGGQLALKNAVTFGDEFVGPHARLEVVA